MRRSISVAAFLVGAVLVVCSTWAQVPGRSYPGWDFRDPVNISESREYARLFFEYQRTGVMTEEFRSFRFSNPAPQGTMTAFRGAEVVFDKIYADRLNYSRDGEPLYSLADLRRDDPEVDAAFRLYATTGKLQTPLFADPQLTQKHLEAYADAMGAQQEFASVEEPRLEIVNDRLQSEGLFASENESLATIASAVAVESPVADTIKDKLPGVPSPVPYWPDGEKP